MFCVHLLLSKIYWQRLKFSRILDCSSIKVTRIVVKNLLYKSWKKMWRSRWKKLWKTDAFHNFYHHFNNFRKWAGQIFKKSKKALLKTIFPQEIFYSEWTNYALWCSFGCANWRILIRSTLTSDSLNEPSRAWKFCLIKTAYSY